MAAYTGIYVVKDATQLEDGDRKSNNAFLFLLWSYQYTVRGILKSYGIKVAR